MTYNIICNSSILHISKMNQLYFRKICFFKLDSEVNFSGRHVANLAILYSRREREALVLRCPATHPQQPQSPSWNHVWSGDRSSPRSGVVCPRHGQSASPVWTWGGGVFSTSDSFISNFYSDQHFVSVRQLSTCIDSMFFIRCPNSHLQYVYLMFRNVNYHIL